MNGMREALEAIRRESIKRKRLIQKLYKGGRGWKISRIADHVGVTRQRVQQILKRNSGGRS